MEEILPIGFISVFNTLEGLFVWIVFILSLLFFLFSFFIIHFHLTKYSLNKSGRLIGEMVYIIASLFLLTVMSITFFTITLS